MEYWLDRPRGRDPDGRYDPAEDVGVGVVGRRSVRVDDGRRDFGRLGLPFGDAHITVPGRSCNRIAQTKDLY